MDSSIEMVGIDEISFVSTSLKDFDISSEEIIPTIESSVKLSRFIAGHPIEGEFRDYSNSSFHAILVGL